MMAAGQQAAEAIKRLKKSDRACVKTVFGVGKKRFT